MEYPFISDRIYLFIIFSSMEKKYTKKSFKSVIMENSSSKLYLLNMNMFKGHESTGKSEWKNFFKFKTNLLSDYGDKVSFQTHAFFLDQVCRQLDKNITVPLSLLSDSKKNSYVDLKLYRNCLNKILESNSNVNLYFREEYEILKADYLFQKRLIKLSLQILEKSPLFSKNHPEINPFTLQSNKTVKILKMFVNRLQFFEKRNYIVEKTINFKKLNQFNKKDFSFHKLECKNLYIEEIIQIFRSQVNWIPNRYFFKKIFRETYFSDLISYFKKIDLYGCFIIQKLHRDNQALSFDLFRKKNPFSC